MHGPKELLNAAQRAQKAGRLQEAAQLYGQVLTFDAENVGALVNLGVLLAEMRQAERGEALLRRAVARAPNNAEVCAGLSAVLHDQNKFDEAIEWCERGLKLAPDNKRLLNTLASSLSGAERYEEAIALLTRMIAAHPGYAKASHFIGTVYTKLGRCDEAVRAFDKATAIDPRDVGSFVAAGECLLLHGRAAEALERIERALRLAAFDVRALALKTLALAELGRTDEEKWLADPHHFVRTTRLADLGYGAEDVAALNRALADFAGNERSMREDPPEYATYKSWHTTQNLADSRDGAVGALKQVIDLVFEQRVRGLAQEDPAHPFVRSVPARYHLDLWAVKMASAGKMLPHIHADGWLSGVYYVEVPAIVDDPAAGEAGWLKIGSPRGDIKLTRPTLTRTVKPEPGLMVTFPSYLWHDTVPLPAETTERRLCLAFDLHPRKAA